MSIRECPKCNQPLTSETRRENSSWEKATSKHIQALNEGLDDMHKIIGGCFLPSDVEYLVCPVCKWECIARTYDDAISDYWSMKRMFDRIREIEAAKKT